MNETQLLTIENHYRFTGRIVEASEELLKQAKESGSLLDFSKAIETCLKTQEFAGRELLRYRVRKTLVEATCVINGDYDGQTDVKLGTWSDGLSEDEVSLKAESLIELHRGVYS